MQVHTANNPAKLLGDYLSECINTHNGDVICLLSGGSALAVMENINLHKSHQLYTEQNSTQSECRTIFMMGDERWSRESEVNNSLQLQAQLSNHFVSKSLIETIPHKNESLVDFATRIEKIFQEKISTLQQIKIFMILGIGTDGHTAGIFPLPEQSFKQIYKTDAIYVPVHIKGLTIDSRASFTPNWICNHVDTIFAYAVGDTKRTILNALLTETKTLHERPAEIIKMHKDAHIFTDQLI